MCYICLKLMHFDLDGGTQPQAHSLLKVFKTGNKYWTACFERKR